MEILPDVSGKYIEIGWTAHLIFLNCAVLFDILMKEIVMCAH